MIDAQHVDAVATLSLVSYPGLLAVLWWIGRRWVARMDRWFDRMERLLEEYRQAQTECQISLARVYHTREDAEEDSKRQWDRLEDHGRRIAVLEVIHRDDGR